MAATIFTFAAALNAALLAFALGYRAWGKRAASGLYAAAFLLCAASAVAVIALDHSGLVAESRIMAFSEAALTLAAGPLFVLFILSLLERRIVPLVRLGMFAPLLLYFAVVAAWPTWTMGALVSERLVLIQMSFTAFAATQVIAYNPAGARGERARALAFASLAPMALLHLSQIVRTTLAATEAMRDIVPIVGAASFLALTGVVYFGGRVSALDPLTDPTPPLNEEAQAVAMALDEVLSGERLRDASLTGARTAASLGVAPEALTRAIRAVHGLSFSEYLQKRRVAAAELLLADPQEARTSMEAIGLLVGFGSRSAFYKAFNEHAGMSPAIYRRSKARNVVQDPEIGQ